MLKVANIGCETSRLPSRSIEAVSYRDNTTAPISWTE
jgi:hypothetical protein